MSIIHKQKLRIIGNTNLSAQISHFKKFCDMGTTSGKKIKVY